MSVMTTIKRTFTAEVEARAAEDGDETLGTIGHAAVFNQRTLIGSRRFGFVEEIAEGAFDDVLQDDVRFLLNHAGIAMARTKNGTLRLSVDDTGLVSDADLNPKMRSAQDVHAAIEREDIDQMSFAFTILDDDVRMLPEDDPDFPGMALRTINKIGRLFDVSAVTFPAYEGADIGARSAELDKDEIDAVIARGADLGDELPETPEATEAEGSDDDSRSSDELLPSDQLARKANAAVARWC